MYLYAGIAGFGYGVYSAIDQALNVDVLPNKEEAGKGLGILNLATTLGQAVGPHHHLRGQDHDRHLHAGVRHLHRHGRVRCRVRAAYPEGEVAAASAYLRFKGLILTLRNIYFRFKGLMPK